MKCSRCQHDNRPGAKFCEECAAALERACAGCGALVSPTAKFCPECAHPIGKAAAPPEQFDAPERYTPKHLAEKILTSKSALEDERKHVTVLFADLKGSMERVARIGQREEAKQHLAAATTLYREMDMRFWLETAQTAPGLSHGNPP